MKLKFQICVLNLLVSNLNWCSLQQSWTVGNDNISKPSLPKKLIMVSNRTKSVNEMARCSALMVSALVSSLLRSRSGRSHVTLERYVPPARAAAKETSSSPYRAVRLQALGSGNIALCSWARHITLKVPLSTQVYKWVPVSLMLEGNPAKD